MSVWGKKRELEVLEKGGYVANGALDLVERDQSNGMLTPDSVRDDQIAAKYGKPRSHIAAGCTLSGNLVFEGSVQVDGKVSGEIICPDMVIIGPRATVDANIKAAVVVVIGRAGGEIKATDRVEMLAGGRIEGSVTTPAFQAESGCLFTGRVSLAAHARPEVSAESLNGHAEIVSTN